MTKLTTFLTKLKIRFAGLFKRRLPLCENGMNALYTRAVIGYGIPNEDDAKLAFASHVMRRVQDGKGLYPKQSLKSLVADFHGAQIYGAAYDVSQEIRKKQMLAKAEQLAKDKAATLTHVQAQSGEGLATVTPINEAPQSNGEAPLDEPLNGA